MSLMKGGVEGRVKDHVERVMVNAVRLYEIHPDTTAIEAVKMANSAVAADNLFGIIKGGGDIMDLAIGNGSALLLDKALERNGDIITVLEKRMLVEIEFRKSLEVVK